jgi:hypothetical protein
LVVAAWAKRTVVLVALMAMVAGLVPPASAQPAPSRGKGPTIALEPETFAPGAINRTPQGGPVPEEKGQLLGGQPQPEGERRELVERRTEDSQTFDAGGGVFETVFYDGAVNYRDESGTFQPIDSTLVPSGGRGAALRSKAGAVDVERGR